MSVRTIGQLRQRMIDDMTARQLGPQTQQHYIRGCKRFAVFLGRSPETASADDIRRFQLDLAGSGLTISNRNGIVGREVPVSGDAATARPGGRVLSDPRAAEDPAGDEPG